MDRVNRCSFCGKKQSEVRLIAGPGVFICSQCVALCNEILAHDPPPPPPDPGHPESPAGVISKIFHR